MSGLAGSVRCGALEVAENRAIAGGRRIALRVVVADADSVNGRVPDPLFVLAGGPGQAASALAPFASEAFGLVRRHRDLVMIDARGTGGSSPLGCALVRSPRDVGTAFYPAASVRACRDSLSRIADLAQYTTEAIVADLDEVREALGYERVNVYGTSYGSRLALAYLRRHPARVRSMVLKAIAPPTLAAPMNYAKDAERALDLLERDCAAQPSCHSAFASPTADLRAALARADRGELRAAVGPDTIAVGSDILRIVIAGVMQSTSSRTQLPMLLHQAALGDPRPVVQLVAQVRRELDRQVYLGMHLSVSCAESRRVDLARAERDDAGTWLGPIRVRAIVEACRDWPVAPVPADAFTAVSASAPVLLVSGELDPNLPPRWGEEAARTLRRSRHVVLAGVAHGWSAVDVCGAAFIADFIARASTERLDVGCAATSTAPPFVVPRP